MILILLFTHFALELERIESVKSPESLFFHSLIQALVVLDAS